MQAPCCYKEEVEIFTQCHVFSETSRIEDGGRRNDTLAAAHSSRLTSHLLLLKKKDIYVTAACSILANATFVS